MNRRLKYDDYLKGINNCPSELFSEVDNEFSRWVHDTDHENNYKPINLISNPPPRVLDDSDLLCMGYGLSFFDSVSSAFLKYSNLYKKKRAHQQLLFIEEKGNSIAILDITSSDGVADSPNSSTGHLTFHEYEETQLNAKILSTISIFDQNGNIKDSI